MADRRWHAGDLLGTLHNLFLEPRRQPPPRLRRDALFLSCPSCVQEDVDEFFDAKSLLGSLQSAFSESFGLAASSIHQAHSLAVSVHKVGGGHEHGTGCSASIYVISMLRGRAAWFDMQDYVASPL